MLKFGLVCLLVAGTNAAFSSSAGAGSGAGSGTWNGYNTYGSKYPYAGGAYTAGYSGNSAGYGGAGVGVGTGAGVGAGAGFGGFPFAPYAPLPPLPNPYDYNSFVQSIIGNIASETPGVDQTGAYGNSFPNVVGANPAANRVTREGYGGSGYGGNGFNGISNTIPNGFGNGNGYGMGNGFGGGNNLGQVPQGQNWGFNPSAFRPNPLIGFGSTFAASTPDATASARSNLDSNQQAALFQNLNRHQGQFGTFGPTYAPNYASASGSFGPGGYHQTAQIYPTNPASPNVDTRFGGDDDGVHTVHTSSGGAPGFYGVSTSSFSSSSDVNGQKQNHREAVTSINDNGKVTTYRVKSP